MPQTRYKQLVDRLAVQIRGGQLAPGTRLPTHRMLAAREGLSLTTATRVYAELGAMGLVIGETGRGTFVRESALPAGHDSDLAAVTTGVADLSFNYPALPGQAEMLRTGLRQLAAAGDLEALLRYQPHGGRLHERAIAARHLAERGLKATREQVLWVDGAQHGLAVTALALLQPGDLVAVDALTYPGFKVLGHSLRLELAPLPAAGQGTDLDALERLCRRRRVRAVYAMPTLHNPLGWVSSASRRRALVVLARRFNLLLIEDGAYAFLEADPPPPLAALAPERSVYVSGLSKNVATGLRVGFVAAPTHWVPAIERAIRATTWNTPGVMTALACGWLEDGTVTRLEREKRADARARQAIAQQALGGMKCITHPGSYFLWLPLSPQLRAEPVAAALMAARVAVGTAEAFSTTRHAPQALRIALGSLPRERLHEALQEVRRVIEDHAF